MLSQNLALLLIGFVCNGTPTIRAATKTNGGTVVLWPPTLMRAASFYAPFSAGSGDVRFHTPLGVASPARPVATQHLVFWRFGGIAPGHFLYPPLTATRPAAPPHNGPSFAAQSPTKKCFANASTSLLPTTGSPRTLACFCCRLPRILRRVLESSSSKLSRCSSSFSSALRCVADAQ